MMYSRLLIDVGESEYPNICLEELKWTGSYTPGSDSNSIPPECVPDVAPLIYVRCSKRLTNQTVCSAENAAHKEHG